LRSHVEMVSVSLPSNRFAGNRTCPAPLLEAPPGSVSTPSATVAPVPRIVPSLPLPETSVTAPGVLKS
jgi:hypothetical protein